ncbi:ABC transporter permease [Vallitaleaceae bacterium 9-2]
MYEHILKYRLKCLLRDKDNMFWIFVFPIVLSTLLYITLNNIGNQESFHKIPVGLVASEQSQEVDQLIGATDLIEFKQMEEKLAIEALKDETIIGYVLMESDMTFVVQTTGIQASLVRLFLNQYQQTVKTVHTIAQEHPDQIEQVLEQVGTRQTFTTEVSASKAELDPMLVFFFALIAMTCMYGAYLGLREAVDIQADLSDLAARVNIAPIHKIKTFFYSISAAILIQVVIMSVLLAYIHFVLTIDLGERGGLIYLTSILGSIMGVLGGAFIGTVFKTSENMKGAIVTVLSLVGGFLSGLMDFSMKYVVAQKMPILTVLNPVGLLADAYYALYVFDALDRYWINIFYIIGFIIIFFLGTYVNVRRRKYASI